MLLWDGGWHEIPHGKNAFLKRRVFAIWGCFVSKFANFSANPPPPLGTIASDGPARHFGHGYKLPVRYA